MPGPSEKEASFAQLFATPTGQQVLKALQTRFKETTELPEGDVKALLAHERGKRDVIKYIENQIERGQGRQ